jgi:hypothetical protein
VFNGILNDLYEAPWNDVQRWNQYWVSNYAYYDNQEYTWTSSNLSYNTLKNVQKMEEEAKRSGAADLNPYAALGKYLRAYFFVNMTQRVGDIPMQEALQGLKNIAPKYDTQKEVYLQSLTWLEEANDELAQLIASGDKTLAGDIYLSNDLSKWQKVVNSFKLRIFISLSKKEADPELAIKTRFAEVLNNPAKYPIISSMADNMTYVYNSTTNKYPFNPDEYGKTATRNNMAATY